MIEWDPKLATGHASIDSDHHELTQLLNLAMDDISEFGQRDSCMPAFKSLIARAQAHFRFEEALMIGVGYAGASAHTHHHRHLLKQLIRLYGEIMCGARPPDSLAIDYLHIWLVDHILTFDKHLATWLAARVPKPGARGARCVQAANDDVMGHCDGERVALTEAARRLRRAV